MTTKLFSIIPCLAPLPRWQRKALETSSNGQGNRSLSNSIKHVTPSNTPSKLGPTPSKTPSTLSKTPGKLTLIRTPKSAGKFDKCGSSKKTPSKGDGGDR